MTTDSNPKKNLRTTNLVLLAVLLGLVALIYVVSIIRMGEAW